MTCTLARSIAVTLICGVAIALSAQQPPAAPPPSQSDVSLVIRNTGDPSLPPKLAVPPFIALTNDAETQAAAKVIGDVLWDDLEFEKEYYMIPRDTYRTIPQPASLDQVPLDRWKELNADGVLVMRCSLGRHREEHQLQASDEELVELALHDLTDAIGLSVRPIDTHVQRWGGGLPQYAVGHLDRVATIRAEVDRVPGLVVCGAAYDGVGIPACIASAHHAVAALLPDLPSPS